MMQSLVVVLLSIVTGCTVPCNRSIQAKIQTINNDDVFWHGTVVGLYPELSPKAEAAERSLGKENSQCLVAELADPERFVVVHLILCHLYPSASPQPEFNYSGLHVSLSDVVLISLSDRPKLMSFWKAFLQHPETEDRNNGNGGF
jgi:hypothetical protein